MRLRTSSMRWLFAAALVALVATLSPGAKRATPAYAAVTFTVNDSGDDPDLIAGDGNCDTTLFSSTCTLRAAIEELNASPADDYVIDVLAHVTVESALPDILLPVTITSSACSGAPCAQVRGGGNSYGGFLLRGGDSTISNLVIRNFDGYAIGMLDNGGNTISGNYIGTDITGSASQGNGSGVVDSSPGSNTIGGSTAADRNVISGNDGTGITIGASTTGTVIIGNYIGTTASGSVALGNGGNGVSLLGDQNQVNGSSNPNVISGNAGIGVSISGDQNVVRNNIIGLNATFDADLGNAGHGVHVSSGTGNKIGDFGTFQIISGNGGDGVRLEGSTTTNTILDVNLIGLNGLGNASIGNSGNGVTLRNGASSNAVGINIGNRIAGNTGSGVRIEGATTLNNILHHNLIGTSGTAALPNGSHGVVVSGTGANTIGDSTSFPNTISGNAGNGILIENSTGVAVRGNRIGTNSAGTATLGNSLAGVQITSSTNSGIGGSTLGARNTISGNPGSGVVIQGMGSTGNKVEGNYIGTDATGGSGLGNGAGSGVGLFLSASANTIGGSTAAQGNLISGHAYAGVFASSGASNNTISANRIGTNASGNGSVGNTFGILVDGGANNIVIGGATDVEGNLISGNSIRGVQLSAVGAWLRRNKIGTDAAGTAGVPNGAGVYINTPGNGLNTVGGFGSANVIAFNTNDGVEVDGSLQNAIRVNSIHSNGGVGIDDLNGGNTEIAPPVITTINATTIAGTSTCNNCAVDIFSDDEDEGRTFFAAVTTNGAGAWSILGGVPGATNLTTTVTSAAGNTSEFSSPKPYDTDGDGVVNGLPNLIDNCSGVPNVNQLNTDAAPQATPSFPDDVTIANSDALGDACDVDDDNDGIIDGLEYDACAADLDPLKMDTDGDRTMDQAECDLGTNPNDAFSKPPAVPAGDTDGDGLPSSLEAGLGSNPSVADTDGDGVSDGIEYRGYHSSPTLTNTDGDACADDVEIASVDTNTVVNAIDLLNIALQFQRTDRPVQDLSKNGVVNSLDLLIAALNFNALPC